MRKRRLRNCEVGQAMVLAVVCMTCLFGFLGFAADVGLLFRAKRVLQSAADSAAVSGAAEIGYTTPGVTSAARAASTQNGITDGVNGASVAVNYPPPTGERHAGDLNYVEVVVTQSQPTLFMKMFNQGAVNVTARAVAGRAAINQGCVFVMDPSASPAMKLQGSFTVNAQACGIVVNSNATNALNFTGGGGSLTAKSIGVVGGDSGHTGDSNPAPITGIAPVNDPLSFITPPTPPIICPAPSGGKLTGAVGAGCYSGDVTITNATLSGTMVFTGNVTLSGTIQTGTGGVTLDLVNGGLSESTGSSLNLVAPTTGTYSGIVIMEPKPNASQLAFAKGSACGTITGIIYAPDAQLYLQDSGGGGCALNLTTDLVVGTLFDKTATLTITSYSAVNPTTTLLKVPALVE